MDKSQKEFEEKAQETVSKLLQEGLKVQVLGQVTEDGKIELDQDSIRELQRKFPNTKMMFVALNSPFDPTPCQVD